MRFLILTIVAISTLSGISYGQGSARDLAIAVITGNNSSIIINYPKGTSHEDLIVTAGLQAQSRLNSFMISKAASEEATICYAILLLDQEISFAAKHDSAGTIYKKLISLKRILSERLLKLDTKGVEQGAAANP